MKINIDAHPYLEDGKDGPELALSLVLSGGRGEGDVIFDQKIDLKAVIDAELYVRTSGGFFDKPAHKDSFLALADFFRGFAEYVEKRADETPIAVPA